MQVRALSLRESNSRTFLEPVFCSRLWLESGGTKMSKLWLLQPFWGQVAESRMALRTYSKPHILSVQMTVKRGSGTFLSGGVSSVFAGSGVVPERDQRLATTLGFFCPASWSETCSKPLMGQETCSSSSHHTPNPMRRREEEQGKAHLSNHKTRLRKSRISAHTYFGGTFVTWPL